MDIALLNVKVTLQKKTVLVDKIGNQINEWSDYYFCHATVSGEGSKSDSEKLVAGAVTAYFDLAFTVRYCRALEKIDTLNYRIVFDDELYNIISIDHMNYKNKCLKFRCQKVRR